jgi:hypothetical protein
MENSMATPAIDYLKKITLSVTAGTSPQTSDITDQPRTFSFIFGLSPDGLTPFEFALTDKTSGDEVCLQLKSEDLNRIFRHINPPCMRDFVDNAKIFLTAHITAVEPAESREVIRAMAAMAECESGCDCGCGCGC